MTVIQIPEEWKKNMIRCYFDYCGIITTEYKWTISKSLYRYV